MHVIASLYMSYNMRRASKVRPTIYLYRTAAHTLDNTNRQESMTANATGLYHVAFEVPDKRSFALAYSTLVEAGIQVAAVDHYISWAGENAPLDEATILEKS